MASNSSPVSIAGGEDDFMRVLDEMNRLCGSGEDSNSSDNQDIHQKITLSDRESASFLNSSSPKFEGDTSSPGDSFEDIFSNSSNNNGGGGKSSSSSAAPLIGDQLLSSAGMSSNNSNLNKRRSGSVCGLNRSRHCSANSAKSCVSFDSAIGDVYSVQTPTVSSNGNNQTMSNSTTSSFDSMDRDLFDLSGTSSSENSPTLIKSSNSAINNSSGQPPPSLATSRVPAGVQFDNLAASVLTDDFDTSKDVEGLGGISLRLVGSEDVDLAGTSFSLAINDDSNVTVSIANEQNNHMTSAAGLKRRAHHSLDDDIELVGCKKSRLSSSLASSHPGPSSSSTSLGFSKQPTKPSLTMTPQMMHQRREVERICLDLLKRFQHACSLHPKTQAKTLMSKSGIEDPLLVTTRLLSDSLTRLRIFVHSLEPMDWLSWNDRNVLYSSNVCTLSVFKTAVSVNLEAVPMAYPLPYGEYLGEVEALHLILAHDLYNELRSLLSHIQSLGIREFPVMLLVMMIAFFTPQPNLKQPDKVVRVNDYYAHKLQVYLSLRFGPDVMASLMPKILSTIDRVRSFSQRLREFLNDVTRCGLQKQFESVCENIGLIAFLLQTEPKYEQVV